MSNLSTCCGYPIQHDLCTHCKEHAEGEPVKETPAEFFGRLTETTKDILAELKQLNPPRKDGKE